MRLIDFRDNGFKDGAYISTSRRMITKTAQNQELEKTRYIKEKREKLKKVRELLKFHNGNGASVEHGSLIDYKKWGFKTLDSYLKRQSEGMFFNVWCEISFKRELEIECYLLDIFDKADELAKTDEFKSICYLIDEKYTHHVNIFDNLKDDHLYNREYNDLIFDLLQNKINEISKIEPIPISDLIRTVTKKPLVWNANKNTIGTLFGVLYQNGIITGTNDNICKGLSALFSNLSETTLKDNLNLKINANDNKTLYDTATETLLKDWIQYLKNQKEKKDTVRSTTKQK